MSLKKIAFVVPKLGRGGAERVVFLLVNSCREAGLDVLCVCLEELGGLGEDLKASGVQITCLNSRSSLDFRSLFELSVCLKRFSPDIVNIHGYSVLPYVIFSKLLGARFKTVLTAHGLLYPAYFSRRRHVFQFFSRWLSGLTAVSQEVAERHKAFLGWQKPVEVIINGVPDMPKDLEGAAKLRAEYGIASNTTVFLVVGNIRQEKGIEDLLRAVATLSQKPLHADFCVLVVGAAQDPDYASKVKVLSGEMGLEEKVFFVGHRKDLPAVYSAGDIFLLPSRSEGLPIVILEAMSCHLPIIATKVGGVPGALNGYPASLVEPRSPEQLGAAMRSFLVNPDKRNLTTGVSQGVDFTVERMSEKYLHYFSGLCSDLDEAFHG